MHTCRSEREYRLMFVFHNGVLSVQWDFRCCIASLLLVACLGCSDQTIPLESPTGAWQKQGTVIEGGPGEEYAVQEPSVLYENGTFELWFTCGWSVENMCYATSPDGVSWTRQASGLPLIQNVAHGFVTKIGSTYYYYAAILPASKSLAGGTQRIRLRGLRIRMRFFLQREKDGSPVSVETFTCLWSGMSGMRSTKLLETICLENRCSDIAGWYQLD